jgi:hypothetical protein
VIEHMSNERLIALWSVTSKAALTEVRANVNARLVRRTLAR